MKRPKPNLFVVGAMKCGTTSVYNMLHRTSGVIMCRVKEPNHFCTDLYACPDFGAWGIPPWICDEGDYLSLYREGEARWLGEASPNYLYSTVAATRIRDFNAEARIVILLRSPIERAWSEYLMQLRMGKVAISFTEIVREDFKRVKAGTRMIHSRYISGGMYAQQVERYLQQFPARQVFIEVVDRPHVGFHNLRTGLSSFLGVEVAPLEHANPGGVPTLPRLNHLLFKAGIKNFISDTFPDSVRSVVKTLYYRSPGARVMAESDREFLSHVFRDEVTSLSAMLDVDLSFWQSDHETKTV
ncbi:MAG TPA: hypothetical protein VFW28_15105 [Micropepsaceae bacterium]|nr:hypothetical protein [Micropepsaceae bacterium]